MKMTEKDRRLAFATLALLALASAAFVIFFLGGQDSPADGAAFYHLLKSSDRVGFLYDVRGAEQASASAAYQCGVDMISRGRFAGKTVENIGCDNTGCLLASTDGNGTTRLTFESALSKFSSVPYILVRPGEPGYKFFQRHMEIYIGNATGNTTCDLAATEG